MHTTQEQRGDRFKDLTVYQIYTRSFRDSDGDGIGDFNGVIEKLDYLAWLGVDVIWLSPFCTSPNKDNGYDVSNYRDVSPEFGTLENLDRLIAEAHRRKLLVMMDVVMNHSSIEHPWFRQRPEYYYWTDKPNNWDSYFHHSAWTWDEERGQYYLHLFYPEQPDLNWENPDLRAEMHDIARFWISRGIDAFRMDAIHHIGKPDGLPDVKDPKGKMYFKNFKNTPRTHSYLRQFNEQVIEGTGVFTVGETGGTTPKTSRLYVDRRRKELDMIFLFDHLHRMNDDLRNLPRVVWPVYRQLSRDGWNTLFFGNHDFARQLSIFGDESMARESASAIAVFLLTLWGTPFVYQGEEIGMTNVAFDSLDDYDCTAAKGHYYRAIERGADEKTAFAEFRRRTRDNARTPMQWSPEDGAGFTSGRPWLGINPDHRTVNVESQRRCPGSILENYRFLIALRKLLPALRRGNLKFLSPLRGGNSPVVYLRELPGEAPVLVMVNPQKDGAVWKSSLLGRRRIAGGGFAEIYRNYDGEILGESAEDRIAAGEVSTAADISSGLSSFELGPWEARIYVGRRRR
jgi:glycosidase